MLDGGLETGQLTFIRPRHGSTLTSARFHHKLRLRQATRLSSPNVLRRDQFGRFISGREINTASAVQFCSNLILIEVGLQIAAVPALPAPAFASTPQRTMMTKRIENPAAVPGRQNQAKSWLSVGTRSCSSAESVRTRAGGAPSAKSTDEQELVPTDDHEWRTDDGEP